MRIVLCRDTVPAEAEATSRGHYDRPAMWAWNMLNGHHHLYDKPGPPAPEPSRRQRWSRSSLRFGRDKTAEEIYALRCAKRRGYRPRRYDTRRLRADGKMLGGVCDGTSWGGRPGHYLKRRLSKARRRAGRWEIEGDVRRADRCMTGIRSEVDWRGT